MPQRFVGRMSWCGVAIILAAGCGSPNDEIQKHAEKVDSLRATAVTVIDAWLAGNVSGTYTRTTLEQTFQLVDQERAAVAATPESLAQPAANAVAHEAEQLARALAALSDAVRRGEPAAVRRHISDLPAHGSPQS